MSWFIVLPSYAGPQAPNKGNKNGDNHCFMNAAHEAFFHIEPLRKFLDEAKNNKYYDYPDSIAKSFINYIDTLNENKVPGNAEAYRDTITKSKNADQALQGMIGRGQHDALEYFTAIINQLKFKTRYQNELEKSFDKVFGSLLTENRSNPNAETIKETLWSKFNQNPSENPQEQLPKLLENVKQDYQGKIPSNDLIYDEFLETIKTTDWKSVRDYVKKILPIRNKVDALFAFKVKKKNIIEALNEERESIEIQNQLLLIIPSTSGKHTLNELLEYWIEGDNAPYKIEGGPKQGTLTRFIKKPLLDNFPEILVIQLGRFAGEISAAYKNTTPITFPLKNLDLAPYSTQPNQKMLYDLIAVIEHGSGNEKEGRGSINGGHYWAQAKWGNHWYEYDDARTPIVADTLIQSIANQDQKQGNPYVLIYERIKGLEEPFNIVSPTPSVTPLIETTIDHIKKEFESIKAVQANLEKMLIDSQLRLSKIEATTNEQKNEQQDTTIMLEKVQKLMQMLREKLIDLTKKIKNLGN